MCKNARNQFLKWNHWNHTSKFLRKERASPWNLNTYMLTRQDRNHKCNSFKPKGRQPLAKVRVPLIEWDFYRVNFHSCWCPFYVGGGLWAMSVQESHTEIQTCTISELNVGVTCNFWIMLTILRKNAKAQFSKVL